MQLVILTPVLILLLFLAVQFAIYFHAANVASAAVTQGAAAGSPFGQGDTEAVERAAQIVDELAGHLAEAPDAETSSGYVVVTVRVAVPQLLPFFPDSVTRSAREPRERFVPQPER